MNEEEEYKAKQIKKSTGLDELRSIDISKYKPNPMVERLLADQVEELKNKVRLLENELAATSKDYNDLRVKTTRFIERSRFKRIFSWIRNFVGIALGISGGLVFSQDALLSKIGLTSIPILAVLFLLSCIFSFSRREKSDITKT